MFVLLLFPMACTDPPPLFESGCWRDPSAPPHEPGGCCAQCWVWGSPNPTQHSQPGGAVSLSLPLSPHLGPRSFLMDDSLYLLKANSDLFKVD